MVVVLGKEAENHCGGGADGTGDADWTVLNCQGEGSGADGGETGGLADLSEFF